MISHIKHITFITTLCIFISVGCNNTKNKRFEAVKYDQLLSIVKQNDDKLYVVNFWATWCRPCMEELPHFLEVDAEYRTNKKYEMILVSLDMSSNLHEGVAKVVKTMHIQPDVLLLDDAKRMNDWIPMIDTDWDGAIPVTAFYKNGKQLYFHEGQLSKSELEQLIKKHI